MAGKGKVLAIAAACIVGVGVSAAHVVTMNAKCAALEKDKIDWATVSHYLSQYGGGSISMSGPDGGWVTYPKVRYSGPQEYLDFYPDCCRYYPGKINGYPLSWWERYVGGQCGFAAMSVHIRYRKDGQVITNRPPSAHVWLIDNSYTLSRDPKDR